MCYNSANSEQIVRQFPIRDRETVDNYIKDFILEILILRGHGYKDNLILYIKTIGKDHLSGSGTLAWKYKQLIKEKKYKVNE